MYMYSASIIILSVFLHVHNTSLKIGQYSGIDKQQTLFGTGKIIDMKIGTGFLILYYTLKVDETVLSLVHTNYSRSY